MGELPMKQAISAVYDKGVLRPVQQLPLDDQQEVLLIVLPLKRGKPPAVDPARVARMQEQTEAWLAQQPADAVREPLVPYRVADDFDAVLAEIRERASRFSEAEIAADVNAALAETRELSPEEREQLDSELDALLAELAIHEV